MTTLIVFSGLPSVGKTTIARLLAARLEAVYLRIDTIEQAVRAAGIPDVGTAGYTVANELAASNLELGRTIVADCVNPVTARRAGWRGIAARTKTRLSEIVVVCSDEAEHRRRIDHLRDGRRVVVPGLVLVRQKPGSAKGIMFITVEDETSVANLILWPDRFIRQRALVLSATMLACHGRVQREGEVVHVITERLDDLLELLRSVGERDEDGVEACRRGDRAGPGITSAPGASGTLLPPTATLELKRAGLLCNPDVPLPL